MIRFNSSLQTARIIVEQVINDSRTQNIDAVVFSFVHKENSIQQGFRITGANGDFALHIFEHAEINDIIIERTMITSKGVEFSTHVLERDFDKAKEFIINQLLKHSRRS